MGASPWTIKAHVDFTKSLAKLPSQPQKRITKFIETLQNAENPLFYGKRLKGHLNHYWSFRVGAYRLIADVQRKTLTIVFLYSGHRKEIYEKL